MKLEIVYIILIISLILNIIFFYFDIVKFIFPKIKNIIDRRNTITSINNSTPELIANQGLKILMTKKSLMEWKEPKGLIHELLLLGSKHYSTSKEYRLYNYPRAYLFYGLSEFFVKTQKQIKLKELKKTFDNFIGFGNHNTFEINRIDQIPFGLTALTLYEEFGEVKYLDFSKQLYVYLLKLRGKDGIISYREGQDVVFADTLGMIVPFLIKYNKYRENENLLELAKLQLDYYIQHGIDKASFIPSHAIHRTTKVKVGSINWGRGISWYLIALSNYYHQTGEFEKEFKNVLATLNKLRTPEGLWQQFPGSYGKFDASASTTFLYSLGFNEDTKMERIEILDKLKPYLRVDGCILETSGDTYGPNHYSSFFGKSEFTQGMLLLLLSKLKN